jgi:hypothetical protein
MWLVETIFLNHPEHRDISIAPRLRRPKQRSLFSISRSDAAFSDVGTVAFRLMFDTLIFSSRRHMDAVLPDGKRP